MEHSQYYDWCKKAWDNGWIKDINNLKIWVQASKITDIEFKEITGQDYVV